MCALQVAKVAKLLLDYFEFLRRELAGFGFGLDLSHQVTQHEDDEVRGRRETSVLDDLLDPPVERARDLDGDPGFLLHGACRENSQKVYPGKSVDAPLFGVHLECDESPAGVRMLLKELRNSLPKRGLASIGRAPTPT